MPFAEVIGDAEFYDREILRSPSGLDDVPSHVIDSTTVEEYPASSGRYVLPVGTVLCSIPSSSKLRPAEDSGEDAADIVGILGRTQEFWLGPGITAGDSTDQPVNVYHFNCHFDVSKLYKYSGNAAAVQEAMPSCKFS